MSLFGTKEKQDIEALQKSQAALQKEIEALKDELESSQVSLKEKTEESKSLSEQIGELTQENVDLRGMILPEQFELDKLYTQLSIETKKLEKARCDVLDAKHEYKMLSAEIVEAKETILFQSFGLYTPHFDFVRADEYKSRLLEIRAKQKDMIKAKTAIYGEASGRVNGSEAKGKKLVSDMQKLLLRAFNAECDDVVEHVTYSNVDSSEKRITSSRDAISKLGDMMGIGISTEYYRLKLDELHLAFEYQLKKQEEKDAQKEARAEMREAAKLAKELETARQKLEKEQTHYQNALRKITVQLSTASDDEREAIEAKKEQLEQQLEKIDKEFKDVDYREANQRAGYVYIISNIGAFGENVYKIGMTRRLDPMDRVDELGDASVPFDFDVHAMIFSNDAPTLETALHNAFADRKLNFVNQRREFFRVTLDEIKKVVKENFDQSVEFVDIAPAEQYRESLLMREGNT